MTSSLAPALAGLLQRRCACGQHTGGGECEECRKKSEAASVGGGSLQRAAVNREPAGEVPPIVYDVLRSSGQPLDAAARAFFEPRFGYDFSQVRVHTDARAAESARAVNALAYTVGRDVVFGAGQCAPGTAEGNKLLAHELTHLVQQARSMVGIVHLISSPRDEHEQEADRIAHALVGQSVGQGGPVVSTQGALERPAHLQRLVRTSLVTCPAGQNPFGADRQASTLLDNAIARIGAAQAVRAASPADPDVVAVGSSLHTAFRMNPGAASTWTAPAPDVKLPVITRRLEIAKDYIDSVVFTVKCIAAGAADVIPGCAAGTCSPGTNAISCDANPTAIDLCPPFWALSLNQRGRTWAHEVLHINFGFINDWGQPDVHNAHCYAQFVALLNGFNPPADRRCH